MAKRGLKDVLQPHRQHLEGEPIPSIGMGEPLGESEAMLNDMEELARVVKRRGHAAPWLELVVINAFELGKKCGLHGGEVRFRSGHNSRGGGKKGGEETGRQTREKADDLDWTVRQAAAAVRQMHPHDRRNHSTRWLAKQLQRKPGRPESTIRSSLQRQNIS